VIIDFPQPVVRAAQVKIARRDSGIRVVSKQRYAAGADRRKPLPRQVRLVVAFVSEETPCSVTSSHLDAHRAQSVAIGNKARNRIGMLSAPSPATSVGSLIVLRSSSV
jgi:hypothetical protein